MLAGQETPCAGIPDSGTTAIMGPQEHLDQLYESLCDGWDRCSQSYTARMKTSSAPSSKAEMFNFLLSTCDSWMESADGGLEELPPISFSVRGSDKTEQQVQLPGWAYITSRPAMGGGVICDSAFSAMEYNTAKNGPVWIFGTPFFFTHEVGYDLQASPPGISFTSLEGSSCGSCEDGSTAALVAGSTGTVSSSTGRHRRPRVFDGKLR